ncbi:hypothetical protein [Dactylosporangium darangshiense]|uniref:hypothetical protein n=1 Tax=Dactylosporangium darangshiense TaxID=579108 RepID=UPI0031E7F146
MAWAPKSRPGPAEQPAPARRRRPVVLGTLLATLATLTVGLTAYSVARTGPADRPSPAAGADDPTRRQAYELLLAAAGALSSAPGQHYHGSLTADGGREVGIDARVTREGLTLSTVDFTGGGHGDLLDLGRDGTYARGDAAFWSAAHAPGSGSAYGTAWVRIDFDALGFDPRALIPSILAADLLPAGHEDEAPPPPADLPRLGDLAPVGGVEARQVRLEHATVWITTAKPPRIVRVEPAPAPASGPGPAAPALDVEPLDGAALSALRTTASQRAAELDHALDSQVTAAIDGQIKVGPCAPASCVATVTVINNVNARSPYMHPAAQVNAEVTIEMTLDDKHLNTCTETVTMPANGKTTAKCTTSYSVKQATSGGEYFIGAKASTSSRALTPADVQRLTTVVAGPPPAPPVSPSALPPPCARPTGADGGPGHWHPAPVLGAPAALAYQEQVTGVRADVHYRVGDRDFDGYRTDAGAQVLLDAKPEGSSWQLWGARPTGDGRLAYADDEDKSETAVAWANRARHRLDAELHRLRAELDAVRPYSGAKLRLVTAEADVLDKLRAYAKSQLPQDDYARLEWRTEPVDRAFTGCP